MKKNTSSKLGIFNLRTIAACAFLFGASLLTYFSLSARTFPNRTFAVKGISAPTTPTTTITVNNTSPVIANDGFCTLPEAIIAANTDTASGSMPGECPAGSGNDTIMLQTGATYTLVAAHNSS